MIIAFLSAFVLGILPFSGPETIWPGLWILATLLYFLLPRILQRLRAPVYRRRRARWFLAAELVTDMVWGLIYAAKPGFFSVGVGLVYGLPGWAVILACAAWCAVRNTHRAA